MDSVNLNSLLEHMLFLDNEEIVIASLINNITIPYFLAVEKY